MLEVLWPFVSTLVYCTQFAIVVVSIVVVAMPNKYTHT